MSDSANKRRVTQADVARAVGVSQAMVSYVVNDTANGRSIPAETRRRIGAAIDELGYVPNVTARRLRLNKTSTIAGVIPDITNPFYPEFQRGILDTVAKLGYDLVTYNTDGTPEREHRFLQSMLQGRVDGIIGVFFTVRAVDLEPLVDRNISIVRLEAGPKRPGPLPIDNIYVDNLAASRRSTAHLIALGHTRIGMLTSPEGPASVRHTGYEQALEQHGLAVVPELTASGAYSEHGGYDAMNALLERTEPPSAILAANDLMALGAMVAIREASLRIPDDIAVVGFDDIAVAKLVEPSLTTVAQFQRTIGQRAAEMLIERLDGSVDGEGRCVEMPFELIERRSTVPRDNTAEIDHDARRRGRCP